MDKEQFKNTWNDLKAKVKKKWGELTNDELEQIKGDYEKMCAALERKYGYTKEQAKKAIKEICK